MKKIFSIFIILVLITLSSYSQQQKNRMQTKRIFTESSIVYDSVDVKAHFKMGAVGWEQFISGNFDNTFLFSNNAPPGLYTATARFIIEKDSTLSNIVILQNPGYGVAEEFIRILKISPKWSPAILNGKVVRSYIIKKISFKQSYPEDEIDSFVGVSKDSLKVYEADSVDVKSEFKGGATAWNKYLIRNLNNQTPQFLKAPSGVYTAKAKFIIEKDGTLSNIVIEKDPGYGVAEESIRVLRKSPNWIPAILNGKVVRSYKIQNITFNQQKQ